MQQLLAVEPVALAIPVAAFVVPHELSKLFYGLQSQRCSVSDIVSGFLLLLPIANLHASLRQFPALSLEATPIDGNTTESLEKA